MQVGEASAAYCKSSSKFSSPFHNNKFHNTQNWEYEFEKDTWKNMNSLNTCTKLQKKSKVSYPWSPSTKQLLKDQGKDKPPQRGLTKQSFNFDRISSLAQLNTHRQVMIIQPPYLLASKIWTTKGQTKNPTHLELKVNKLKSRELLKLQFSKYKE